MQGGKEIPDLHTSAGRNFPTFILDGHMGDLTENTRLSLRDVWLLKVFRKSLLKCS
jgi:hypothetical protein